MGDIAARATPLAANNSNMRIPNFLWFIYTAIAYHAAIAFFLYLITATTVSSEPAVYPEEQVAVQAFWTADVPGRETYELRTPKEIYQNNKLIEELPPEGGDVSFGQEPEPHSPHGCMDQKPGWVCAQFKHKGYCTGKERRYEEVMAQECAKSCGKCGKVRHTMREALVRTLES